MSIETLIEAIRSLASVNVAGAVTVHLVGVLNDLLFVIILLELMRTVTEHLKRGGFQLRPFLIIGVVSSVRRILVLGAQLSVVHGHPTNSSFYPDVVELGVETGVVLVLTVALFIASRRKKGSKEAFLLPQTTNSSAQDG